MKQATFKEVQHIAKTVKLTNWEQYINQAELEKAITEHITAKNIKTVNYALDLGD